MVLCTRWCGDMSVTGSRTPPPAPGHLLLCCISEQNQIDPHILPSRSLFSPFEQCFCPTLSRKTAPSRSPWSSMMINLIVTSVLPSSWTFRSIYTADHPLLLKTLSSFGFLDTLFSLSLYLGGLPSWSRVGTSQGSASCLLGQLTQSWGFPNTIHSVMNPTFVARLLTSPQASDYGARAAARPPGFQLLVFPS